MFNHTHTEAAKVITYEVTFRLLPGFTKMVDLKGQVCRSVLGRFIKCLEEEALEMQGKTESLRTTELSRSKKYIERFVNIYYHFRTVSKLFAKRSQ